MTVQRSVFLLTIKEDLTGELRNCLHLVSVHDVGLKVTLGKVSRGFDDFNTVYFLDSETDMDFYHSQAFCSFILLQANEKLTSVQSKLCVDNKRCQSFVKSRIFCF